MHVYVSAINQGADPVPALLELPLRHAGQIHLAGFAESFDSSGVRLLIDNHGASVASAVWALFDTVLARVGPVPTLLERDQNIQIETLALFIRYYLTVSTPVPEAHQEAARAQGKARFEQFVEQLGRHLLRGRSLVRDVVEELQPDSARMDDAAALAEAQERVQ